jgi:ribose/xylose/arabinose/galactoside ABC-type transport system permease subunit
VLAAAVWSRTARRSAARSTPIGGNERSALLMGLPVARTRIAVYALSGACSALGGVLFALYMLSGYGLHAQGLELDAIAAVVIGGTLLTGGVGYVAGTLTGVLMLGVIQTLISLRRDAQLLVDAHRHRRAARRVLRAAAGHGVGTSRTRSWGAGVGRAGSRRTAGRGRERLSARC